MKAIRNALEYVKALRFPSALYVVLNLAHRHFAAPGYVADAKPAPPQVLAISKIAPISRRSQAAIKSSRLRTSSGT
jgi:hypothetical protein